MSGNEFIKLTFSGDWALVKKFITSFPEKFAKSVEKSLQVEGEYLAAKMRERIDSIKDPPNALITAKVKKSSKPLINNADMRNAIAPIPTESPYQILIGIPASAPNEVRLADIHENGRTIVMVMTDKQRRFLHMLYKKHGIAPKPSGATDKAPGILVIHIPARPFIEPTFQAEKSGAQARFEQTLTKLLQAEFP